MNAVAGTTSSSARSNGARASVVALTGASRPRSVARIDERALDRDMHPDLVAQRRGPSCARVQENSRGGDDINQRIATAILDVLDPADDRVQTPRPVAHHQLLRADRHAGARSRKRLLAHAGEADLGARQGYAAVVLRVDAEFENVAI